MKAKCPDIFDYQSYRDYLRDYYEFRKETTPGFSLRSLKEEMKISTHAHYFDVMYGRTLTEKFIPFYTAWFGLNAKQEKYFRALVTFEQASGDQERKQAFQLMAKLSPKLETLQMSARYMKFFEKWYQPILLTLLAIHPKLRDAEILARFFRPRLTAHQIQSALALLQEFGMIQWDNTQEQWLLTNRFLKAEDSARELALKPFHRQMQEFGIYHYDNHYDEQQFSCLTLATTTEVRDQIKEVLREARAKIMDLVRQDPKQEILLQVNMQSFQLLGRGG